MNDKIRVYYMAFLCWGLELLSNRKWSSMSSGRKNNLDEELDPLLYHYTMKG